MNKNHKQSKILLKTHQIISKECKKKTVINVRILFKFEKNVQNALVDYCVCSNERILFEMSVIFVHRSIQRTNYRILFFAKRNISNQRKRAHLLFHWTQIISSLKKKKRELFITYILSYSTDLAEYYCYI